MKLTEFAERGSIKEKLAWTFKLYDKDMSGGGDTFPVDNEGILQQGTITAKEMLEVIGTVITMEGLNKVNENILKLRQITLSLHSERCS